MPTNPIPTPRQDPNMTRRAFDLTLEINPIAVTDQPDAVELVARYPDGSYDRSTGATIPDAMQRLALKIDNVYRSPMLTDAEADRLRHALDTLDQLR